MYKTDSSLVIFCYNLVFIMIKVVWLALLVLIVAHTSYGYCCGHDQLGERKDGECRTQKRGKRSIDEMDWNNDGVIDSNEAIWLNSVNSKYFYGYVVLFLF